MTLAIQLVSEREWPIICNCLKFSTYTEVLVVEPIVVQLHSNGTYCHSAAEAVAEGQ